MCLFVYKQNIWIWKTIAGQNIVEYVTNIIYGIQIFSHWWNDTHYYAIMKDICNVNIFIIILNNAFIN